MKNFLVNTDETGRFIVTSQKTGKKYFVEVIGDKRAADWGSYNPSTGNIENKKGHDKFSGCISEDESMITVENGFDNVKTLPVGTSPFAYIESLEKSL